jgi:hypothetical protein
MTSRTFHYRQHQHTHSGEEEGPNRVLQWTMLWFRRLVAGLSADARVCARVSPCEIYGGQNSSRTGFPTCFLVFHCQYHSTVAFHTHITPGHEHNQKHNLTPSTRIKKTSITLWVFRFSRQRVWRRCLLGCCCV